MLYVAHCMNIIFNSLLAQLVKYDVHTTRKIKFIHAINFLSHIIIFVGWRRKSRRSESEAQMDGCQLHDAYAELKKCVFRAVLKVLNGQNHGWKQVYCSRNPVQRQQRNVGGSQKRR